MVTAAICNGSEASAGEELHHLVYPYRNPPVDGRRDWKEEKRWRRRTGEKRNPRRRGEARAPGL